MKVDLVRPAMYGRVIGWNEFAGYAGMSATAVGTGLLASTYGLRPEPFVLGLVVAGAGLTCSFGARETRPHDSSARAEGVAEPAPPRRSALDVLREGSWAHPALSAASASGLATNFKDGALWGLLPLVLAARSVPLERIGVVVALYPGVWALSQLYFGPLSDRVGRKALIIGGLATQAVGVLLLGSGASFGSAAVGAVVTGLGTGMVYPTLLAFVSEQARPGERASALGVYRLWRDSGYAFGALGAGLVADRVGSPEALVGVSVLLVGAAGTFALRGRAPG
jgi:MFS family permease